MTTLLYVVRPGPNEELRYSLRSAARNVRHDDVCIVGNDLPDWLTGVGRVEFSEKPGGIRKWENIQRGYFTACSVRWLEDDLVLMNDDFFAMRQTDQVQYAHRGPLVARKGSSRYASMFVQTRDLLRSWGVTGPVWDYELHLPMPARKPQLFEVLRRAGRRQVHTRSLYANFYGMGGLRQMDVKLLQQTGIGMPYISTNDFSFRERRVGEFIRSAFPDPCKYERNT